MSLETFKIIYFSISLLSLAAVALIASSVGLSLYFGSDEYVPDTLVDEHLLRAFTHLRKDILLHLNNAFLWCIVPVSIGLTVKKKLGDKFVWLFFALIVLLKTRCDDYFPIHMYQASFVHSIECPDVLLSWTLVYVILALFVTKGSALFEEASKHKSDSGRR